MQKSCFQYGRSWPHCNGESQAKGKIGTKCGKPNHFVSPLIVMFLIMKFIIV